MKNSLWIISIIILGLLIISVFAFQSSIFTSFASETIAVTYRNIKLYIDGSACVLKDIKGRVIEPFIYKDTIYIPLDIVARKFGGTSTWSYDQQTLWITQEELNRKADDYYIDKIDVIESKKITKKIKVKFINSNIYVNDTLFNLEDDKGNKIETLLYDGIAYLPSDIIGSIFNKERIWSKDTLSVYYQEPREIEDDLFVDASQTFTLEKLEKAIDQWYKTYGFIEVKSIGKSYEGRDIRSVIVNYKKDEYPNKEKILLLGGIHAREDFSVMLNAKMLDYMLYHLTNGGKWENYDLESLFSNVELHVIITSNPDGLNIVHNGIKASKNNLLLNTIPDIGKDNRWWKANARGVDLNRNFPDSNWDVRLSDGPASEGYKGDYAASEIETQAIIKYCEDNNFNLAVSYHTSGNNVFWADKGTHEIFKGIDSEIIDRFTNLTGYEKLKISEHRELYGSGFENWFREKYHRLAFCVELSPYPGMEFVQHPDECFDSLVWRKAKFSGLFFMEEAVKIKKQMYDVYKENKYIKSFYNEKEAIDYAKDLGKGSVFYLDDILWTYKD